jgi:hypothetical protein
MEFLTAVINDLISLNNGIWEKKLLVIREKAIQQKSDMIVTSTTGEEQNTKKIYGFEF